MKYWYRWRRWLWLSALIPATLITVWPGHRWLNILSIIIIAAIGVIYYWLEKKQHHRQMSLAIRSTNKNWITTMNHHRHDWMNDLQVLFGYIRLGRQESITQCIEKIKTKMYTESAISKLQEPLLVGFLMSFSTLPSNFQLNVCFNQKGEFQDPFLIEDEQVSELIIAIITAYRLYSVQDFTKELELKITFENNHTSLNIQFTYNGEINHIPLWKEKIEQQLKVTSSVQIIGALSQQQIDLQITRT